MTSESGIAHESIKYAMNYNLPIQFIIEDNNLSVCTDTLKTWKMKKLTYSNKKTNLFIIINIKINIRMLVGKGFSSNET